METETLKATETDTKTQTEKSIGTEGLIQSVNATETEIQADETIQILNGNLYNISINVTWPSFIYLTRYELSRILDSQDATFLLSNILDKFFYLTSYFLLE